MGFIPIKSYEGLYSINEQGIIRHEDKYKGKTMDNFVPAGIMKTKKTKFNRENVGLLKHGKKTFYFVHRLVALHFIPNPFNKPEVNHLDGNPMNNDVSNLEWCTKKENSQHAWKNGLMRPVRGKDKKQSKPVIQMDLSGNELSAYESINQAAIKYGFQKGNIIAACKGRYQQAYGFKWKYA